MKDEEGAEPGLPIPLLRFARCLRISCPGFSHFSEGDRKKSPRAVMVFIALEKWIFFDILKEIVNLLP